ncbi:MAG: hypothetical protein ABI343_15505 [Burkholderiaceae bacterium]
MPMQTNHRRNAAAGVTDGELSRFQEEKLSSRWSMSDAAKALNRWLRPLCELISDTQAPWLEPKLNAAIQRRLCARKQKPDVNRSAKTIS